MNEDPTALDKALEDINLYAANLFSAGFKSADGGFDHQMGYELPRLLELYVGKTSVSSPQTLNQLHAAPTTRSRAARRACFRPHLHAPLPVPPRACGGSTPVASASRSTATCSMKTPKPSCKSPIRSATRTVRPIRTPCNSRPTLLPPA
ncbi:MAG: hypothetical protein ACLRMJ_11330 [Alistipes finegoldii]